MGGCLIHIPSDAYSYETKADSGLTAPLARDLKQELQFHGTKPKPEAITLACLHGFGQLTP